MSRQLLLPRRGILAQLLSEDVVATALAALADPTTVLETWEFESTVPGHVWSLEEQVPSSPAWCIYTLALGLPRSETRAPVILREG